MNEILKNFPNGSSLFEKIKSVLDEAVTANKEKQALAIKLQRLVRDHELSMLTISLNEGQSARVREGIASTSGSKNLTQNILAYAAIGTFMGMTGYILSHGLGRMNSEESFIIGNLTGIAAAIAKDIYGYYFGSSKTEHDSVNASLKKHSNK